MILQARIASRPRLQNSFQPTAHSRLQRKCPCGRTPVSSSECAECKRKRLTGLTSVLRLQRKLQINEPGDIYEQEADRIADEMLASSSAAQTGKGATPLQIQCVSGGVAPSNEVADGTVDDALAVPGRPLESRVRQEMEHHFGYDFSHVQVHSDRKASESARTLGARAYTVGQHIVFSAGEYQPTSTSGRRLLAHELTHVLQQDTTNSSAAQFSSGGAPIQRFASFTHIGLSLEECPPREPGRNGHRSKTR